MQELLGRSVAVGDLVLYDMKYALVISKNMIYKYYTDGEYDKAVAHKVVYLVENPTEKELCLKNLLCSAYNKDKQSQLKENREYKELINKLRRESTRGDLVEINSSIYLYFGKGRLLDTDGAIYTGHIYMQFNSSYYTKNNFNSWFKGMNGKTLELDNLIEVTKFFGANYLCYKLSSMVGVHDSDMFKILKSKSSSVTSILGHYKLQGSKVKIPIHYRQRSCSGQGQTVEYVEFVTVELL